MRRWISGAAAVAAAMAIVGSASPASANVNGANVRTILLGPTSCGFDVRITSVVNNQFNGAEQLRVDGTSVGTFSSLVGTHSSLSVGTHVLMGTPDFASEAGIPVDVTLLESVCGTLGPGALIEFLGSFGPVADSYTLPDEFDDGYAYGSDIGSVDLALAAIILFNATGASETLGMGPPVGGRSGGGCSVGSRPDVPSALAVGVLAAAVVIRRRRRDLQRRA